MFATEPPGAAGQLDALQRIFLRIEPSVNRFAGNPIFPHNIIDRKGAIKHGCDLCYRHSVGFGQTMLELLIAGLIVGLTVGLE